MIYCKASKIIFYGVALFVLMGGMLKGQGEIDKRAQRLYSRLNECTVSDVSFDVLSKDQVVRLALYFLLSPETVRNYPQLLSTFEQQVKFRPEVMGVLQDNGVQVEEFDFFLNLLKGTTIRTVIAAFSFVLLKTAVDAVIVKTLPSFSFEDQMEIKALQEQMSVSSFVARSFLFGLIVNATMYAIIVKGFSWNPNSLRMLNPYFPNRYKNLKEQVISYIPYYGVSFFAGNFVADVISLLIVNPLLMDRYVSSMKAEAEREFGLLEEQLPKEIVAQVESLMAA